MNEQILTLAASHFPRDSEGNISATPEMITEFAELIVKQCGYYADIFEGLGCPQDMDPTETKPSDYIKRQFGVEE